jgi:hypothetical protein
MRIIAALTDEVSIRHYLTGVGLPSAPPPIAPARSPPQTEFLGDMGKNYTPTDYFRPHDQIEVIMDGLDFECPHV